MSSKWVNKAAVIFSMAPTLTSLTNSPNSYQISPMVLLSISKRRYRTLNIWKVPLLNCFGDLHLSVKQEQQLPLFYLLERTVFLQSEKGLVSNFAFIGYVFFSMSSQTAPMNAFNKSINKFKEQRGKFRMGIVDIPSSGNIQTWDQVAQGGKRISISINLQTLV